MNENLQQKLEQSKKQLKLINTYWFDNFFGLLARIGIDDNYIIQAIDFAFNDKMLSAYRMGGYYNVFNRNSQTKALIDNFFKYLKDMEKEIGKEEFKQFLLTSLEQIKADYTQYLEEKHSAPTNFFNLFMKRLLVKNPQDVEIRQMGAKIENLNEENEGRIDILIGGVSVGHLEYDKMKSKIPLLSFFEFRTLPGLERLGLGTYMFSEFCEEVVKIYPDASILATNVAKDKDGSKTYSHWGAYPIITTLSSVDEKIMDIVPLSKEEYNSRKGPFIYYFSPDIVKKCAEKSVKYSRSSTPLSI